jgi:hypothetical protein
LNAFCCAAETSLPVLVKIGDGFHLVGFSHSILRFAPDATQFEPARDLSGHCFQDPLRIV